MTEPPPVNENCPHPRARHRHGTHLCAIKDHCKCELCVIAARKNAKISNYRTATGTHTYVDATPARDHVKQLLEHLTIGQLEQRSGVNRTSIHALLGHIPGKPASRRVTRTTANALLAVTGDWLGEEQGGLVDVTGTTRRLRALIAIGYTVRYLMQRTGMSSATAHKIIRRPHQHRWINAATRNAVAVLYDEISARPAAPSPGATAAIHRAASYKWVPPLAWDDDTIDDPKAKPSEAIATRRGKSFDPVVVDAAMAGNYRHALAPAERDEVLRQCFARGLGARNTAARAGISRTTIPEHYERLTGQPYKGSVA